MLGAVNLSEPGRYLHWSIFVVSEANLALIAVMVLIFGVALLAPFPRGRHAEVEPAAEPAEGKGDDLAGAPDRGADADARMWTNRLRRWALRTMPPGKLLPDRQPAYVSSWIYVFGVASLAALGLVIVSGFVIAVGGSDWWHTNSVGHFFNSIHLWSVELFMAFLVIHLWGKFWMAAWRGRRRATWITGVVAFVAAIIECFTGYLSQQNFDSQWIATNGKDAFNAAGVGSFFNLMNFGQMLLFHVVLVPLVLVALIGAHVLLVRSRGVAHPLPEHAEHGRAARRANAEADAATWRGPTRRYDIVKEGTIAAVVVLVLGVSLAAILSSPDVPPVSVRTWSMVSPADFLATAASELDGTSLTATYGPPYSSGPQAGTGQRIGIGWQQLAGVRQPVDSAETFVVSPLSKLSATTPALRAALRTYQGASPALRSHWAAAYSDALSHATFVGGQPVVPPADDGPVPVLLASELTLARSGALDADLLAQRPFYGTDFTKPLLFLEDGEYYAGRAKAEHLTGSQWGVMNETGSYPGQPWLWLYTLWYQVPGLRTSTNVDLIAIYLTGLGTLLLLAIPFIPGLRDIPRLVPLHRLVWRDWNRSRHPVPPTASGEM